VLTDCRDTGGALRPVLLAAGAGADRWRRLAVDRMDARLGKLEFTGDYRYEPVWPGPHRVHLRANRGIPRDLEAALMPDAAPQQRTCSRAQLGRPMVLTGSANATSMHGAWSMTSACRSQPGKLTPRYCGLGHVQVDNYRRNRANVHRGKLDVESARLAPHL